MTGTSSGVAAVAGTEVPAEFRMGATSERVRAVVGRRLPPVPSDVTVSPVALTSVITKLERSAHSPE